MHNLLSFYSKYSIWQIKRKNKSNTVTVSMAEHFVQAKLMKISNTSE